MSEDEHSENMDVGEDGEIEKSPKESPMQLSKDDALFSMSDEENDDDTTDSLDIKPPQAMTYHPKPSRPTSNTRRDKHSDRDGHVSHSHGSSKSESLSHRKGHHRSRDHRDHRDDRQREKRHGHRERREAAVAARDKRPDVGSHEAGSHVSRDREPRERDPRDPRDPRSASESARAKEKAAERVLEDLRERLLDKRREGRGERPGEPRGEPTREQREVRVETREVRVEGREVRVDGRDGRVERTVESRTVERTEVRTEERAIEREDRRGEERPEQGGRRERGEERLLERQERRMKVEQGRERHRERERRMAEEEPVQQQAPPPRETPREKAERGERDVRRERLLEAEMQPVDVKSVDDTFWADGPHREMVRQKEVYRRELEARRERRHLEKEKERTMREIVKKRERSRSRERKKMKMDEGGEKEKREDRGGKEAMEVDDYQVVTVSDDSERSEAVEEEEDEEEEGAKEGEESEEEAGGEEASSEEDDEETDSKTETDEDVADTDESPGAATDEEKPRSSPPAARRRRSPRSSPEDTDSFADRAERDSPATAAVADKNGDRVKATDEAGSPERDVDPVEDELPPYLPAVSGCRSVEEFQCLNRIEEGTYGVVYRARDRSNHEVVALKRLKMEKEKEGFPITSLREINTLLKAQHKNIVTVREIVVGSNMDKIFIVMDYVEHDLKSLMETMKQRKQVFIPGEVKCLMQQLLRATAHLHDNWILHRDLKTSNLLLSHKGILKVGDFGLAREYGSPLKAYTPVVVTLWYRSPELLLCTKEYSTPIDMWSVGCIFGEFLSMEALFPGKSEVDQINRIFKDLGTPNEKIWPGYSKLPAVVKMTFQEYPSNTIRKRFGTMITEVGLDLMNKFLTYDPVQRITADDALRHPYFDEAPLAIDPAMFPTWPAKSELGHRKAAAASPKPPPGGAGYQQLGDTDEDVPVGDRGFHMGATDNRRVVMGAGFNLKF